MRCLFIIHTHVNTLTIDKPQRLVTDKKKTSEKSHGVTVPSLL